MRLKHLTFPVTSVKALDEDQGILEAVVNVYNLVDLGNERVLPGCFSESLARRRPYGCLYHDWTKPVAKTLEAAELAPGDPKLPEEIRNYGGLYVKGRFNLETQDGREAFSNIKQGVLDQFSIGFSIPEGGSRKGKDGVTELVKGDLYEWSVVLWGMNPATAVISAKDVHAKAYFTPAIQPTMTWSALNELTDFLFWSVLWECLFGEGAADPLADRLTMIDEALTEYHSLVLKAVSALMEGVDGDEDATSEAQTEYKQVFAVPALTTGRFDRQLLALLTEAEGASKRADGLADLRESQGRSLFSPERREQLVAVASAFQRLLDRTAPTPDDLDLDLLREISVARKRRMARATGANYAPTS